METANTISFSKRPVSKTEWTGRVISTLCILFLLFDSIGKILKESHSMQGTTALGWSESLVQPIGFVLLICTILYAIPKTSVLGAILLTGYLGGATATMVRVGDPLFFSVILGILVWLGLYLREERLRHLLPLKDEQSHR